MIPDMLATLPQLANLSTFRTEDLDSARAHIAALFVPHHLDVVGRHQVLDVCISCARVDSVSLIYHRHGASVRVRAPCLRDFYLLQIPLRGEAQVRIGREEINCDPSRAFMISPNVEADMHFGRGCEQLIVRVDRVELERQLEKQLGRHIVAPLEFAPSVPLANTSASEITNLLRFMTSSLAERNGISSSDIARSHMASLLMSGLLTCLDHNYREELANGGRRSAKPAYVSRAQEFLKQNVSRPIGPEDVATAVRVSTRALFVGFKTYLNTTPMRYLKDLRLDLVRETLSRLDPQRASITSVAMDYGFHHLGHFCAAYKERFGEQPRETLHNLRRQRGLCTSSESEDEAHALEC
jgi:AraC-like DNA-binding protein